MTNAEQQAYEVLLQEAQRERQQWEYLALAAMVSLECVETCILIGKPAAALMEVDNARQHFERMSKAA